MAQGNFFSELKRRNVLRVAAAYAVASFAIIEVMSNVAPALHLPDWALSFVVVLLALGFPAVVAFAWVYEITPEGVKRTEDVEANASITHRTAHRLNVVLIVLVAVLIGLYGTDRFLPAREAAPQNAPSGEGVSIAVLPFVNLSGDPSQEFFSDGMTEEITSALAKVQGLKVVARTSAFQFKGENKDMRAVGQALGATILLEGSVRKAGNRVRITGQLIKAADGTHLWTENYDRELTDIFKTQDDIAQAIAGALRVPLGLKAGETLVASRAIDPDSYQQYLRAKALVRARGSREPGGPITQAVDLLDQVIARNPDYAPAWALLSYSYSLIPAFRLRTGDASDGYSVSESVMAKTEAAAQRAIALDARHPGGYLALAYARAQTGKWAEAEDLFKQALALDPNDPDVLHEYSAVLLPNVGRLKDALAMRKTIDALEPFVPSFKVFTAYILYQDGQSQAALPLLKESDVNGNATLASIYAREGKYAAAADALLKVRSGAYSSELLAAAAKVLRAAPAKPERPDDLLFPDRLSYVYFYIGMPDRILEAIERGIAGGDYLRIGSIWNSNYAALRRTERFKALVRKAGLPAYWRARGWPDKCRPVGADDFECS